MRKILVLGTGGTVSCAKGENGLEPAIAVSELMNSVNVPYEVHTEQLFELDSTNMTPRHWERLAREIRKRYDEFDGFVITHGTDTLAYAAASLSCLIQNSRKPIVLTGSMKPMTAENSDAPKNLRDALEFAANERAFGVNVAFFGKLFDGKTVFKIHSQNEDAFDGKLFDFSEFGGETHFYDALSDDVYLVKLIPGQRLNVPESAKAVILESYGAGGVPDYLLGDVIELSKRGVYVIVATQCDYGGTNLSEYEVGQYAAKVCALLETGRMTVEYAVARARWALAYSENYEDFKKIF